MAADKTRNAMLFSLKWYIQVQCRHLPLYIVQKPRSRNIFNEKCFIYAK